MGGETEEVRAVSCQHALKWHQGARTKAWIGTCAACGHQSLSTAAPVLEPVARPQRPLEQPAVSRPLAAVARQVEDYRAKRAGGDR